ncbi:hypothetical protein G9A89_005295 [Geosiphon pyriformis]|nr:hypothetical protein G9A89_005295 [Geosiphon pyriformis]
MELAIPLISPACHFVKTLFNSINYVGWESKYVSSVVGVGAFADIDMGNLFSASLHSYLLKALHYCLPVTMRKRLYNSKYSSVLCIKCSMTEDSDHVFLCAHDDNAKRDLLSATCADWSVLVSASAVNGVVAHSLDNAVSSGNLYILLAKEFVLKDWVADAVRHFGSEAGGNLIIRLVCSIAESHRSSIWLPAAKLRSFYEKNNILPRDGSVIPLVAGLSFFRPVEVIHSFNVRLGIHMCFGLYPCLASLSFGFLSRFPAAVPISV